jgi:acetyl-CoA acetyltransferase
LFFLVAENLAKKYNITRQNADEYALQSQQRWKKANDQGYFKDEIEPIKIKGKKVKKNYLIPMNIHVHKQLFKNFQNYQLYF